MNAITKIGLYFFYVLFVLLMGFCGLEFLLRLGYFRPFYDLGGVHHVLDRQILFKLKANSPTMQINNFGFRGEDFQIEKGEKVRVLFAGDSFVYGTNVSYSDSMPLALEDQLGEGYEVYNLGVQGYGPDQSLIQLKDVGMKFDPDFVILALYPTNDYQDLKRNQLYELNGDKLQKTKTNIVEATLPLPDTYYMLRFFWKRLQYDDDDNPLFFNTVFGKSLESLYDTLMTDTNDIDFLKNPATARSLEKKRLMRAILRDYQATLASKGIPMIVLIIPAISSLENTTSYDRKGVPSENYLLLENVTQKLCEDLDIPFLNLYPIFQESKASERTFQFFEEGDGHFTSQGYRFVARLLAEHIRSLKLS